MSPWALNISRKRRPSEFRIAHKFSVVARKGTDQ
jgi:hypothetical protein